VEIAAHLDRIAPLMGLAPLDVAFTVERVPELMDTPPIVIVEALMTIRSDSHESFSCESFSKLMSLLGLLRDCLIFNKSRRYLNCPHLTGNEGFL
jgi:hypothetical protein